MIKTKFKVGDRVYAPYKYGTITAIYGDGRARPIEVTWESTTNNAPNTTVYAADGYMLDGVYLGFPTLTVIKRASSNEDKTVKNSTTEYTAIDPAHYRVKGIPKAYDLMTHLMHREQLEGFYFCNIIKYVYRYGREGDKTEIAEKIKWNAQKLKELGECESNET